MKWSVGTKIGAGYALALRALVIIGLTSYLSVTRFLETAHSVSHTYQVIDQIDDRPPMPPGDKKTAFFVPGPSIT